MGICKALTVLTLTALAACAIGTLGLRLFVRLLHKGYGKRLVDFLWKYKRRKKWNVIS